MFAERDAIYIAIEFIATSLMWMSVSAMAGLIKDTGSTALETEEMEPQQEISFLMVPCPKHWEGEKRRLLPDPVSSFSWESPSEPCAISVV